MTSEPEPEKVAAETLARYARTLVKEEDIASILELEEICAEARRETGQKVQRRGQYKVLSAKLAGH